MKHRWTLPFYVTLLTLAGTFITQLFCGAPLQAYPTTSRSAVAAVRLKYRPPNNWIRHYLGDDRYKVAGGIWKVVSTQQDTYYHRASCPNMLRQPAGTVIGFADWSEAEESGYVPDSTCSPQAAAVTYASAIGADGNSASRRRGANASQGTRIVLSDGKSSVILPRGWRHRALGSQTIAGRGGNVTYQMDMLSPSSGQGAITFLFMNSPNNVNMEPFLNPQSVERLREQMRQRSSSDPGVARALEGAKIGVGKLGGLRGLTFVPGSGANLPAGMGGRMTIVARGSKMYMMSAQLSNTDRNYGVIVNSFQAR